MKRLKFIVLILATVLPGLVQAEQVAPTEQAVLPEPSAAIDESAQFIQKESLGSEPFVLIDEINCVICGPSYNKPLTDTDLTWKRIPFENENKFIPLQKQIQTDIVVQQVASEKMPMDPSAIEKQVETIKKQLKVNDAELEEYFGFAGRTMAEGLEWVAHQYTTEFFNHYKFKSQLVPTDDEIMTYYQDNPEFVDGWYEIRIARVPYQADDREKIKTKLTQAIADHGDADGLIDWGASIKVAADDLSSDQQFVEAMKVDDIRVNESEGMFELVQLIAKEPTRVKTLDECRSNIIDALNRKKLETMLQAYNETIHEFVDIIPLKASIAETK